MSVPGSNLLRLALSVLGKSSVNYFQYAGVAQGPTGLDTATYDPAITIITGTVQPVNTARYQEFGLDFSKRYIVWFVPNLNAVDLSRNPDISGDVIEFKGRRFQLMNNTDWFQIDGWMSPMAVDIGPATGALINA